MPASRQPEQSNPAIPEKLLARYIELGNKFRQYRPEENLDRLDKAFGFAAEQHRNQKRKSGDPYLSHLLEVAHLLADMRLDEITLVSALLHDVIEDTPTTIQQLKNAFGSEISRCVNGVTKIGRLHYHSSEARQAETFRKMLLAIVKDIRVILIKLGDRLHNMRTLQSLEEERQKRISLETREIYAPIALRLGMGKMRSELEDLCFLYLEPKAYRTITRQIESRREASEQFLSEIQQELAGNLKQANIPSRVEGRIKRSYSIYLKLKRQDVTIDGVYDLLALRVITDTNTSCYAAMGVIHGKWQPVPGRIKDFVAMPRPNLYQSLHTSVITGGGQRFEVQIRTEEMHRMAEEGICAHWKYKEGHKGPHVSDGQMAWLRRLVEWQREVKDSTDFLSTLKIELYPEEVYVFTPQGRLITLPQDATPVDFAYAIHTEVGHSCSGAKVDGQIVQLKRKLHNGEIVEVITQAGGHPSQDWLAFVQTSKARNKIKQWINAERRMQAVEIGRKLLEKEARSAKVSLRMATNEHLEAVCHEYGCSTPDDLYARLGYGRFSVRQVLRKLFPNEVPEGTKASQMKPPTTRTLESTAVDSGGDFLLIDGAEDILIYRARCCNPIPGEAVVGYVTRGKGVGVHSRACRNVQSLMYEVDRRIDVKWSPKENSRFKARLRVCVEDSPGVLNTLTSILMNEGVNIARVESLGEQPDRSVAVDFIVEVVNMSQLERVTSAIGSMAFVRDVTRSSRL